MRILITGATGFIGQHLLPLLKNHKVLILGRSIKNKDYSDFSYLQCDLKDLEVVRGQISSFKPELCIHLAWEGLPDYSLSTCHKNFSISIDLIKMMGELGCRKVFVSGSCWEYGDVKGKVKEYDNYGKIGIFASYKTSLRLVAESLSDMYDFDLIWGRIFYAYGPGQRQNSLIPTCINSFREGKIPDIRTPYVVNDFIHVFDVAKIIVGLVEDKNTKGIYNIASGNSYTIIDIVNLIAELMGKKYLIGEESEEKVKKEGFWADISSIQKIVSSAQIPLLEGISNLIEYQKK